MSDTSHPLERSSESVQQDEHRFVQSLGWVKLPVIDTLDTFGRSELKQNVGMGPATACTARNRLGVSGHLILVDAFAGGDARSRHQVAPGPVWF